MWCVSRPGGARSFYATKAAADAAAGDVGVVWFDSFDYELHNPDDQRAPWFAPVAAEERATGLAYVAQLLAGLRARWIDPWGVTS